MGAKELEQFGIQAICCLVLYPMTRVFETDNIHQSGLTRAHVMHCGVA